MIKSFIFSTTFLLFFNFISAQDKVLKHRIKQGETIAQLATLYKTTAGNIIKLNPDAAAGLKPNMILLIPNNKNSTTEKISTTKVASAKIISKSKLTSHTVISKETLYSLATTYNTTVEAIENLNPTIKTEGLKIGSVIQISQQDKEMLNNKTQKPAPKVISKVKPAITHTVEAKETKYSIAKKYNTTIEALEKLNPLIISGLDTGMELLISGDKNNNSSDKIITPSKSKTIVGENSVPTSKAVNYEEYVVKPKETLYSLATKFGITTAELLKINPSISSDLKIGAVIKYPSNNNFKVNDIRVLTDLSKSATSQDRKKLILLLPFNIERIENDTVTSTTSRLKKDKFLNMTLDFYAGAMQAIDSSKTLGINMEVIILDSKETKSSSNIPSLIADNILQKAAVIIGPFYQSNVERTASLLASDNTIVISPLSKETHLTSPNLIVSNISAEILKNAMFDYMNQKNGNILAIVDNKKLATKQLLKSRTDVKLVPMSDKNTFDAVGLSQYFSATQMNYVILDSENTSIILQTTSALIALQKNFQVQLVLLEKNDALDFEEIPLARLTKLKMLYPSTTKDNSSKEAAIFEKDFKLKNKIFPNNYAIRGFDITFDTILRLAQEKPFLDTINNEISEQVESKFVYQKNVDSGYYNNGVYILEYQPDLTIKQVN